MSNKRMENAISMTLQLGLVISVFLVLLGGIMYLLQSGSEPMQTEFAYNAQISTSISMILSKAFSFAPLGIVELGLLTFVATQILRVGLLAFFYAVTRDYWYIFFSFFIFLTLIYSLAWQR